MNKENRDKDEAASWSAFVSSVKDWSSNHMDQWEKIKFETEFGTVYVTVSRQDVYPDCFNEV